VVKRANLITGTNTFNGTTIDASPRWKAFIHDSQVKGIQFAGSFVDRLYSGDDDRISRVAGFQARRVDADFQVGRNTTQRVGCLLEQFLDVGEDQDAAVPFFDSVAAYRCHHDCLARCCW